MGRLKIKSRHIILTSHLVRFLRRHIHVHLLFSAFFSRSYRFTWSCLFSSNFLLPFFSFVHPLTINLKCIPSSAVNGHHRCQCGGVPWKSLLPNQFQVPKIVELKPYHMGERSLPVPQLIHVFDHKAKKIQRTNLDNMVHY